MPQPFCPSPTPEAALPATVASRPIDAGLLVPVFVIPLAAGVAPFLLRLVRRRH